MSCSAKSSIWNGSSRRVRLCELSGNRTWAMGHTSHMGHLGSTRRNRRGRCRRRSFCSSTANHPHLGRQAISFQRSDAQRCRQQRSPRRTRAVYRCFAELPHIVEPRPRRLLPRVPDPVSLPCTVSALPRHSLASVLSPIMVVAGVWSSCTTDSERAKRKAKAGSLREL